MKNKLLLFDSFNAKYLSFQEVSESFVTNDEFFQLMKNNSILLMGPRGCGKTTLLKMLTPIGLKFWKGIEAEEIKKQINFTAIYIPSDIQWKNQFDYLNKYINGKKEIVEIITQFLFTANIQVAVCKTFNSVIALGDHDEIDKINYEYHVCKSLINVWNIDNDPVPTFDDIEIKILEKVRFINTLINKKIFRNEIHEIEKALPDYVYDNYFDIVKLGCKVFEKILNLKHNHKWALCFDELEIVPKFIQLELIKYLRSVDQKYIFKLTTTPLFNLENNDLEATQGNDFSTIKLWVYDEEGLRRWEKFCRQLLSNRFRKEYKENNFNLEKVFGEYSLDEIIKSELNELNEKEKKELQYKGMFYPGINKGSSINFLFKRLAKVDDSFNTFLRKKNINHLDPFSHDKLEQKSVFLKYKVDAIYRLIYKNRTRRTPSIHYGLPYIFDICDGNPRLVIGLIDEMLKNSKFHIKDNCNITKQEQSRIIYEASDKYFNLIKNHPDSTIISHNYDFNLATNLLEKIGKYMLDKLVKGEFSKTAPSTFRVDDGINHKYIQLLETALSLGAIVYLDPTESLSKTGIVEKRFRLSGFLAPKFKIPSRIHQEVRLSTVLRIQNDKKQTEFEY